MSTPTTLPESPKPSPDSFPDRNNVGAERVWTQDEIDDDGEPPLICPVTGAPCLTEQDEFCDDYGCARKAGIDVDRVIL